MRDMVRILRYDIHAVCGNDRQAGALTDSALDLRAGTAYEFLWEGEYLLPFPAHFTTILIGDSFYSLLTDDLRSATIDGLAKWFAPAF